MPTLGKGSRQRDRTRFEQPIDFRPGNVVLFIKDSFRPISNQLLKTRQKRAARSGRTSKKSPWSGCACLTRGEG
jgi:hypothetical protein